MQKIQIYNQLRKLNLVTWPTLFIGFDIGLISKYDIENYALCLLSKNDEFEQNVALLANAKNYDEYEIKDMILSQLDLMEISKENEIEKLKLAYLMNIYESKISEQEKYDELQKLYVIFNYPNDMSECSIYSNSKNSPLDAMCDLILLLKNKYLEKK